MPGSELQGDPGVHVASLAAMRVAIILYPGFDELDAIGPYEVLSAAAASGADLAVSLVTLEPAAQVVAAHGLTVRPGGLLGDGGWDLVIVPGGGWNAPDGGGGARTRAQVAGGGGARIEAQRGALPAALADLAAAGVPLASVCTGAMLLATAGLLCGRPAVTHLSALQDLAAASAEVIDARVVDDGDIVTAGGVTAGIDLALWLVQRHAGAAVAERVAERLEYRRGGNAAGSERGRRLQLGLQHRVPATSRNRHANGVLAQQRGVEVAGHRLVTHPDEGPGGDGAPVGAPERHHIGAALVEPGADELELRAPGVGDEVGIRADRAVLCLEGDGFLERTRRRGQDHDQDHQGGRRGCGQRAAAHEAGSPAAASLRCHPRNHPIAQVTRRHRLVVHAIQVDACQHPGQRSDLGVVGPAGLAPLEVGFERSRLRCFQLAEGEGPELLAKATMLGGHGVTPISSRATRNALRP